MKQPEKDTLCGRIRGIDFDDHIEYRGIRYATSKRWEYPILVTSWEGTYDATEFGDCSYQRRSFEEDATCNQFYHKEFRENMNFTYSEDSLFLNIWSPKDPVDCPVLIYIHGGSFTGGSANEGHISGTTFAKNGVIFVSFNYRFGPFGFCSHPDLTDQDGICGNYGLYDQYTAIKWVKEFIKDFGGDPENITLMGQSAGAMSVDIHSSSPLEQNWFAGIMMSSGAGLQRLVLKPRTPQQTLSFWNVVLANACVSSMVELRDVDPKTLYYAWYNACKTVKSSTACTLPVYDRKLLTKESFCKKKIPATPCMIGMTITDMMPAILKHLIVKWGKRSQRFSGNQCYTYLFSRELPGDHTGAWHSSDLLYFFSTLERNWRPFEAIDQVISHQMSQSLIAFTKYANPNCNEIPDWEPGTSHPMTFYEHTSQQKWPMHKLWKNTWKRGAAE